MAWTSPSTWVAGAVLTAAQLNQQLRDNLLAAFSLGVDAWPSYTPTLTQSGAVTKTVNSATYMRTGRWVTGEMKLSATGAGTAANVVLIGLPVNARGAAGTIIGYGAIYDLSANLSYKGILELASANTARFLPTETTVANHLGATSFTAALAAGDVITAAFSYEAAS